jgi:hypothetical protein
LLHGIAFACHFTYITDISEEDMSQTNQQNDNQQDENSNRIKDPDEWTTGDQPMTGAQQSYLKTLSDEAGEEAEADLTKAEASKKIDELQEKTGRGTDSSG